MSAAPFPVDPDIRRARTLDPRVFGDPAIHRALLEHTFAASWQLVPVPVPVTGAVAAVPFTLLPGALDEPLLLTRDAAGARRVLSAVCTHRAHLLCDGGCPEGATELVCGYHGRRFGLDGEMRSMPSFEEAQDFPGPGDDLPALELAELGPLLFTRLAPEHRAATSFDVWSAPLAALLSEFEGEELRFDPAGDRAYDVPASWALYVENFLEGFHVPFVHPGLNEALDPGAYRTELLPNGVRQVGRARSRGGAPTEPCLRHAAEPDIAGDYLWLYPNLMVNAYPWGLSVNVVEPTSPVTCRVRYLRWIARPELAGQGAGGDLDAVELEDQAVVARVQRGVRARLYRGGRFSPSREQGPHWFERLLARDLELALAGGGPVV